MVRNFDKVMEAMQPEFEDETPINPFDFWQGANFKLKIVKKDGYWNYDKQSSIKYHHYLMTMMH